MKSTYLKKILDEILDEYLEERNKENKAKKDAWVRTQGDELDATYPGKPGSATRVRSVRAGLRGGVRHADPRQSARGDRAHRPDRGEWSPADGNPVHTSRSDQGPRIGTSGQNRGREVPTRSGDPLQHKADIMAGQQRPGGRTTNPKMTARGYQAVTRSSQGLTHPQSTGMDVPQTTPSKSGGYEFQPMGGDPQKPGSLAARLPTSMSGTASHTGQIRAPVGSTPVPDQVKQAASKEAGGRVLFGRYYDGQGNYLGRSQGGKWVDAASDPNAKTQLEMYNKLMEIETTKYKGGDREMVKDMIREIVRSCK